MKFTHWLIGCSLALPVVLPAQIELTLTITGGNSTTSCTDLLGSADPLWSVNIENQGWMVYPVAGSCFNSLPHEQYRQHFACASDLPATVEVCLSAFENDAIGYELGLNCDIDPSCAVNACQSFVVPSPGDSVAYTLTLPDGGASTGSVTFTLAVRMVGGSDNDDICNAVDLGVLEYGQQLGNASRGLYSNLCATIDNEINPFDIGGWINDAGVWFTFSTGVDPGPYLTIKALSDPEVAGDSLGIELAIFTSSNNACDGILQLLVFQFNQPDLNNQLSLICPQPNTRYYVLVDGGPALGEDKRGLFGLQINDIGTVEGADDRCDAEDLGTVSTGGSVRTGDWRSNFCGTAMRDPFVRAFQSQHSVWFKFRTPPSGHIRVEGVSDTSRVPLDIQLALYRASNGNCNGFFRHLESVYTIEDLDETLEMQCLYPGEELYVLVDGSGSGSRGVFSLAIYDAGDITPVFTQDTVICAGQSIRVANSVYDRSGIYRDTIPLFAGCDSVVITNLTVLETVRLDVEVVRPAVGVGAQNGAAIVQASGGEGAYTYIWCNGETGRQNNNLAGGAECCVTVTDEAGCSDIACLQVPQILPLEPIFRGDTLDCHGAADGDIRFSARQGQAPYRYSWRPETGDGGGEGQIMSSGDTIVLSGLPAGNYEVTIRDAYFDTTFTVAVVAPPPLVISLTRLVEPTCHGMCNGRILLQAAGGVGGYAWSWSDRRLRGAAPANVCAGSYEVTLTDANGCQTARSFQMAEPAPFIATARELRPVSCWEGADGEAGVTTNGRPILYEWNNGQFGAVVQRLRAGSYTVTVVNEDGCQAVAQAVVTQPAAPVSVMVERSALISCADATDGVLTAKASGPGETLTYRWSNGVNTARNDHLGPGLYSVTVENEAGCRAQASGSLEEPPVINARLSSRDITCLDPPDGGRIEVVSVSGGREGYTFSLDGVLFKHSPIFEQLPEGNYTITVRDVAGCEADFDIRIFGPPVLGVSLGSDRTIQLGETIRLFPSSNSANLTIEWDPLPEGAKQGDPILEIQPLETARFAVTVTDRNTFCTASDEVLIQVKKDRKVYLPNVFNPASAQEGNHFFMVYGGLGIEQVDVLRIFDRQGGLVFSAKNFQPNDPAFAWDGTRNGQALSSGVYVYVLEVSFIDGETEVFSGDVSLIR